MAFWKDCSLKPSFWPEDFEYTNIKLCKRESLCKIIQCYTDSRNLEDIPERSHNSPKAIPHSNTKRRRTSSSVTTSNKRPRISSETRHEDEQSHSTTTIHPQCSSTAAVSITDIDSSSKELFFQGFQQDSIYSEPGPTPRLATLLDATPLEPVFEFISIVNRKDNTQSLHELSTQNTFLNSCINTFCVI